MKEKFMKYAIGYMFILPALLFISIFLIYPVVESLRLSFYKWDGFTEKTFVGLKNYITVFQDANFYNALKNTTIYMLSVTLIITFLGFILAVIMDLKVKGYGFYKFVFFLPSLLSGVVVALLWTRIFNPRMGILNQLLGLMHLADFKQAWLGDPKLALFCVILVNLWQYSGLNMVYFLAAIQQINPDIYSSAQIDGANTWTRIFKITAPIIKDQFVLITLMNMIYTAKVFDLVWVMTLGGPGNASQVFGTFLYYEAFKYLKFGYASVVAVIVFIISLIFSIIYLNYGKFHITKKSLVKSVK